MEWIACGGSKSRNMGGTQAEEGEGWQGVQTGALRLIAAAEVSAENVQGCQVFHLKCCWRHIFPYLALPHPVPTFSVLLTPPFTHTGLVTNGLGDEGH